MLWPTTPLPVFENSHNVVRHTSAKLMSLAIVQPNLPSLSNNTRPTPPVSTARQSPLVPESAGLPFRIVSVGLEGESVLVPASVEDAGAGLGDDAMPRRRDAISTSTLPFGASSLPTLAPSCRQELQDRCGMKEIATMLSCVARGGCLSRESSVGYICTSTLLPGVYRSLQIAYYVRRASCCRRDGCSWFSRALSLHTSHWHGSVVCRLGSVRLSPRDASRA